MALHTLNELHSKTANYISLMIRNGYKIDPNRSLSEDKNFFIATLVKQDVDAEVTSLIKDDKFTRKYKYSCKNDSNKIGGFTAIYYKVHDDIYADSEDEAKEEHKKWLATNLGLGDIGNKDPIQAFADKLSDAISKYLIGGKQ